MSSVFENNTMYVDSDEETYPTICECNRGRTSLNEIVFASAYHRLMESGDHTYFKYAQYLARRADHPDEYIQDILELVQVQLNDRINKDRHVHNDVQKAIDHFNECRLTKCVECDLPFTE